VQFHSEEQQRDRVTGSDSTTVNGARRKSLPSEGSAVARRHSSVSSSSERNSTSQVEDSGALLATAPDGYSMLMENGQLAAESQEDDFDQPLSAGLMLNTPGATRSNRTSASGCDSDPAPLTSGRAGSRHLEQQRANTAVATKPSLARSTQCEPWPPAAPSTKPETAVRVLAFPPAGNASSKAQPETASDAKHGPHTGQTGNVWHGDDFGDEIV
jgi:hypothetical protein